jgi:AcrR family transcriptional regulator
MKDKILQTAFEQFLKFGIREMSIKKLVAPIGISTKTVYKYFKNKEELLEEVLNLYYSQQYNQLVKLSESQSVIPLFFDIWYMAIEKEYSVNNVFFYDLHYYYSALERKAEIGISDRFWTKIEQILIKGIKEGVFKADIQPEVALEGIAVLYDSIVHTEKFQKFNVPPNEIFMNTIALYIRGICMPKGIQELDEHLKSLRPSGKA